VLCFSLMSGYGRARGAPYTPLENNISQSVASSIGAMPAAAGLISALPALALLGTPVPPGWGLVLWAVALGALGVLVAHLFRARLLEREALPFPTGIATAEVISAMHASRGAGDGRPRAVLGAGAVAMVVCWLRDAWPRWVPALTAAPGKLVGQPAATFTLGVSWSPMLFAIGAMVGPRVGVSMLLGALAGWGVAAPALVGAGVATLDGKDSFAGWLTWPGVGLMVGAATASLLGQARAFTGAARDVRELGWRGLLRAKGARGALGLGAVAALVTVGLGGMLFGLAPVMTVLVLLLVLPLGSVVARAAGQTDISPVSQMGQLTQAVAGGAGVQEMGRNVAAGAVASSAMAQVGVSMWSLKAGHVLGASPRRQALAQLLGVAVGASVGVPVYLLLVRAYGLGSEKLPAPSAVQAKAIAEVATHGLSGLPPYAALAAVAGLALGLVGTFAERGRLARYLPSAAALGIGCIVPAFYSVSICLGSLLYAFARARSPERTERYASSLAAGSIAGEALMGVLIAALVAAGVLSAG